MARRRWWLLRQRRRWWHSLINGDAWHHPLPYVCTTLFQSQTLNQELLDLRPVVDTACWVYGGEAVKFKVGTLGSDAGCLAVRGLGVVEGIVLAEEEYLAVLRVVGQFDVGALECD